jgi:hypothetical protein
LGLLDSSSIVSLITPLAPLILRGGIRQLRWAMTLGFERKVAFVAAGKKSLVHTSIYAQLSIVGTTTTL